MQLKTWKIFPANLSLRKALSKELNITEMTSQLLINRGIQSVEGALAFLHPSLKNLPTPFLLPDMGRAVDRILRAITNREKIAIYGDYDVDGLCSTALLFLFFQELGIELTSYVPDRIDEGYGLHQKALEKLQGNGVSLVITVDCGTKSQGPLQWAKEKGLDVIVTDHHAVEGNNLPSFAFVNPQAGGDSGIGKELAGVGVAFFLAVALRQKLRETNGFPRGEPNLKKYLDLVALATIADLAPLTGINRALVTIGLQELAETTRPGLKSLKEIAGLKETASLQSSDVGFRLAPRINAGGRIANAALGFQLLTTTDEERAKKWAKLLDQCNQDRQAMQEQQVRYALSQVSTKENRWGLVVHSKEFHPGIVGLIASKMVEHHYRPAVALSVNGEMAKGSARSIEDVSIIEILEQCSDLLEQFGGHQNAAGLTLKSENIERFENRFESLLKEKMGGKTPRPSLPVDAELNLQEIGDKFLNELESLKPYGIKNPEPLFIGRQLQWQKTQIVGEKHLKGRVVTPEAISFEAIGFNLGGYHPLPKHPVDLCFVPQWNRYLNSQTIQLKVKDIKVLSPS